MSLPFLLFSLLFSIALGQDCNCTVYYCNGCVKAGLCPVSRNFSTRADATLSARNACPAATPNVVCASTCTSTDSRISVPWASISVDNAKVLSPLQSGVTKINPVGPASGKASFSKHYSEASEAWQQEAAKAHGFPSLNPIPPFIASVRYEKRFQGNLSWYQNSHWTSSPSNEPARMSDDPALMGDSPITLDPSQAQSLGRSGEVSQGQPDRLPPPTPYRPNPGEICRMGWFLNPADQNCHFWQPPIPPKPNPPLPPPTPPQPPMPPAPDPPLPEEGSPIDDSQAEPFGGAGLGTQEEPDKLPPPNP